MARKASSTKYQAPALEKGLDVLELLASVEDGLTQTQISERLNRTIHELFRMLICLQERGYITRGESNDRFILTSRLLELGLRNPPSRRLVHVATPKLRELSNAVMQASHVTIRSAGNVLVIARQDTPLQFGLNVNLGITVPLQLVSSGIVLLAYQSEEVREEWLADNNCTKRELAYLRKSYPKVLEDGYFVQPSKTVPGVTEYAFPVFDHYGSAVATVSVPILPTLQGGKSGTVVIRCGKKASTDISMEFGWTPPGAE